MNWSKEEWNDGSTFTEMQDRMNSANVLLERPASIDTSYQFGDWITGRLAEKEAMQNQANMDFAEWVRNQASAREQRAWEEQMDNTKIQRQMADAQAAGLNPWLALQGANFGGSVPQGASASSSAGQVVNAGGKSSPGSILAGTAVGLAALAKVVKKLLK